jgi:peptidoglycan hydrolase-like protein with peptidoglycan-binding domain
VTVHQGGQRIVIGHVDRAASPPCSWIEVLDLTGAAQPVPPSIPSEPTCAEGGGALPVIDLSDDGRRLGISSSSEAGNEVRIVDLDLGTEQVVVVPDVQALRLGVAGGLVVSSQGVVELSDTESSQSWLRPFPPDTTSADHFERIEAPLQLNADVARGRLVTTSAAAPPGAAPVTGEVVLAPGSTGEVVVDWQRRLNRWLAVSNIPDIDPIGRTGVYDPPTQSLTTLFLQAGQLPDDGSIDTRDLDQLNQLTAVLESSVGIVQRGDRGEIVEGWQAQLAAWVEGAQPEDAPSRVGADGVFGRNTEDVTVAFETAVGNPADGIVQPSDRTAMASALVEIESGVDSQEITEVTG